MSSTEIVDRAGSETAVLPNLGTVAANLRRLTDLMLDDVYDDRFLCPTRKAFESAWEVIVQAGDMLPGDFPAGVPAPVGDGGILMQWDKGDRQVFLAVPGDPAEGYIYLRGPEHRQTLRALSGEQLAFALGWLHEA